LCENEIGFGRGARPKTNFPFFCPPDHHRAQNSGCDCTASSFYTARVIPVASDLPMIESVVVEVPNPGHPYGAKGAAEVNICPPMAAVANAIERATGQRLTELPMSPPRVLAAIEADG
jgi:hypothetical protein